MLRHRVRILSVLFVWLCVISSSLAIEKQTIGWLEEVKINGSKFQLKAKIDTGATTSSLNAKVIKKFSKDGKKWIRFRVENKTGQKIVLERQLLHYVKIKRKLALPLKRPVVELGICLGTVYRELEVNLSNRKNFEYQMLIGRNYLHSHFLVDSEIVYTSKPSCMEMGI